jgi:hypothetical protein
MTWLIASIVLSSLLFACFKWFDLKKINLLAAISGNYLGCIFTGLVMNSLSDAPGFPPSRDGQNQIIFICLGLGVLFFFTFYAMAYVSAKIGVGIASASSKMSLVIPVLAGVLLFGGDFDATKIAALILALIAVILMSRQPGTSQGKKQFVLPFLVFLGYGSVTQCIPRKPGHLYLFRGMPFCFHLYRTYPKTLIVRLQEPRFWHGFRHTELFFHIGHRQGHGIEDLFISRILYDQ